MSIWQGDSMKDEVQDDCMRCMRRITALEISTEARLVESLGMCGIHPAQARMETRCIERLDIQSKRLEELESFEAPH